MADLIDFNEEELDDDEPGPSSTADSTTRPASSESAQTPEPQTPPTSPHTPLSSRVAWQDASPADVFTSTDDITANDETSQETSLPTHNGSLSSSPMGSSTPPRGSTLPIGCSLTSGSTPPLSSAGVGRSSFKSYIRGSELWGRTEDGAQRSASFKSYRHPKRTDAPQSDDRTDFSGAVSGDRGPIANRSPESVSSNSTPEIVSSPSPESDRTDTGGTDSVSQASSSIGSPSRYNFYALQTSKRSIRIKIIPIESNDNPKVLPKNG